MSIVVSDKTARKRLTLRWPFSRQLTLSVGTLL
ncbi:taurine transporter subunit, partial [Leclercia adecarboxylata]|nr:taurine transporter subunit [Leclercia adecarboxylata]